MKMLRFKKDMFVDAGNITVADFEFYKNRGGFVPEREELGFAIPVESGRYEVRIRIPNTWNDPVNETVVIDVGSEGLVIGDACYFFDETWRDLLKETKYLNEFPENKGYSASTGGDGCFRVTVTVKKIKM